MQHTNCYMNSCILSKDTVLTDKVHWMWSIFWFQAGVRSFQYFSMKNCSWVHLHFWITSFSKANIFSSPRRENGAGMRIYNHFHTCDNKWNPSRWNHNWTRIYRSRICLLGVWLRPNLPEFRSVASFSGCTAERETLAGLPWFICPVECIPLQPLCSHLSRRHPVGWRLLDLRTNTGQPVVLKLQPVATHSTTLMWEILPQLTKHNQLFSKVTEEAQVASPCAHSLRCKPNIGGQAGASPHLLPGERAAPRERLGQRISK